LSADPAPTPVFAEPWQARAFALMLRLRERGHFTATEWSAALGKELNNTAQPDRPEEASHYYQHWLAALESLVLAKGLTDPQSLTERKEAWANAYRRTPHGKPVELG
jgi:nitrile hydratase accessory protein